MNQYDLTKRECEVFKLLKDGFSYNEISSKLDLLRKSLLQVHPIYQCSD
ncbi:LuxR C-terminal-related transcriptional regulator [Acinetobacter baumannii]|nr:LuxR C-terminal-related transcriptional regulator [Acinetobacter baumannii]